MRFRLLILFTTLVAPCVVDRAVAATLRVGTGAGCTHADPAAAVQAAHDGDGVFINTGTYAVSNVHVDGKLLTVRGGYASCTAPAPSGDASSTTINPGNVGRGLLVTGGSDVVLDTLTIFNGNADAGGGIRFAGHGRLTLMNTLITSNQATDGGGLDVAADGPTIVAVGERTLISENHADNNGGGVRLAGDVHLLFVGPQASIAGNTADDDHDGHGDGGGLELLTGSVADIASPGYDFTSSSSWGAVTFNTAINGAGVEVRAGATLRLIQTAYSHGRPTRVDSNGDERTQTGGAIEAGAAGAQVCGWGFSIRGNRAQQIPGVSAGVANTLVMTHDVITSPCGSAPVTASGAVDCRAGDACNTIADNVSTSGGSPVVMAGTLLADRLAFLHNSTSNFGITATAVTADNCLVANNSGYAMIFANSINLGECSIAGNTLAGSIVSTTGSTPTIAVSRSILWQPGVESFHVPSSTQGVNVTVFDTIAADAATFAGRGYALSGNVTSANPGFLDATHDDFRPAADSPAIDYTFIGSDLDVESRPRGIAHSHNPNGPHYDIGAYEFLDGIFIDGFER